MGLIHQNVGWRLQERHSAMLQDEINVWQWRELHVNPESKCLTDITDEPTAIYAWSSSSCKTKLSRWTCCVILLLSALLSANQSTPRHRREPCHWILSAAVLFGSWVYNDRFLWSVSCQFKNWPSIIQDFSRLLTHWLAIKYILWTSCIRGQRMRLYDSSYFVFKKFGEDSQLSYIWFFLNSISVLHQNSSDSCLFQYSFFVQLLMVWLCL